MSSGGQRAKFRKAKGGIKLHTLFDITTQIPAFVHITPENVNNVNAMDYLNYEQSAYYVFDRGYADYTRLFKITQHSAFFVIRAKSNLQFNRMYSQKIDKSSGVLCGLCKLKGFYISKRYPDKLRRVKFHDGQTNRRFIYLTNNFDITSVQAALLYENRWQIELFFYAK